MPMVATDLEEVMLKVGRPLRRTRQVYPRKHSHRKLVQSCGRALFGLSR